jgi:hypothetical protein
VRDFPIRDMKGWIFGHLKSQSARVHFLLHGGGCETEHGQPAARIEQAAFKGAVDGLVGVAEYHMGNALPAEAFLGRPYFLRPRGQFHACVRTAKTGGNPPPRVSMAWSSLGSAVTTCLTCSRKPGSSLKRMAGACFQAASANDTATAPKLSALHCRRTGISFPGHYGRRA